MTRITKATIRKILNSIDTDGVTVINQSDCIEVWVKDCEYEEQERVVTEILKSLPDAYISGSIGKDLIYWRNAFQHCSAHNSNMMDQLGPAYNG